MEPKRLLTVGEALQRPLFQHAKVVAGAGGLHRPIRWVHILEIASFEKLIHGEEMILTTGIGFQLDRAASVSFMDNLIQQQAACLCIELGPYFQSVSDELLELANRCDFPFIVFPHQVRFVDITQDLHSLIINRHHEALQELESVSRAFHRLSLTSQGTLQILKLLHKSTHAQLMFQPLAGKPICWPAIPAEEQGHRLQALKGFREQWEQLSPDSAPCVHELDGQTVIVKPVGALHQTWAYLLMQTDLKPQEYDFLLLDSAALSIAQELLRTRYIEERKLFSENVWVDQLLNHRVEDEPQIQAMMGPEFKRVSERNYHVCLIELGHGQDEGSATEEFDGESIRYHFCLLLRSTFEKHCFHPFITLKNNRLAVIAVDMKSKVRTKERLQQALESLREGQADERLKNLKLLIGVGRGYTQLSSTYNSHQEAVQALSLYPVLGRPILFYDELGVFQLLLPINDGTTLQQFIRNYLGPLLDYDQAKGSELVLTLKVYLDHDGSKQIAAQKLYIVRQSLYYRLEKIAELLGPHFMAPEQRISIQVALRAYQLLYPDKFVTASPPR
ncbi:PucR family transcriptional regulator [Paenibacillus cremeus]|uniref:PucR family transcriptional regulator n=1 Tax=Paenibacillus cremeus TaxID=2163881 RepID=A0A559KEF2_9BACL|nr:PucR family transcriptional regulator [Paenibacillus cremeus]TVY10504.1 PucR family transcriptional regulator [Paenibacillus cremeus]